jgi:hypothetical protein
LLERRGAVSAFSERLARDLPAYYGHCFEALCRDALG